MAHIKTGAATKGNRDSLGKRLGVKVYGGSKVINGNIIIRQRGSKFSPGAGTKQGKDFTIYAVRNGVVSFETRKGDTYVLVR